MNKQEKILLNKYKHFKRIELIKKIEYVKKSFRELNLTPAGQTPYAIFDRCLRDIDR